MLEAIVAFLNRCGIERIEVMHGWTESALEDHPDFPALQWQPQMIAISDLLSLIAERQQFGMQLGRDDLFLEGEAPIPWQVLLCHEGDVHIRASDDGLIAGFQALLAPLGVSLVRNPKQLL
ncbi:hypothetical protein [Deinococcus marmoris]|uniref:hypothetical protein n=1 Tax=Deinococcus marmoris TaxID=249408 RepID=UPI00096A9C12|nr:hypothetical protein [Deinococcus marmoris]